MKKTAAVVLVIAVIMSAMFTAFASGVTNKVYAETVTVEAGEQITVPIKIKNNDGFMGFAVIVTYDENVFTPVSVSKGTMLTGIINDSIATSADNSFKVVFTGTSDIVSDGILFNAVFNVSDEASGKYDIELSYSEPDTFKEGWENAVFNCTGAEVVVTVDGTTAPSPTTTVPTTEKEEPSTNPDGEETTTKPVTEPSTEPSDEPDDGKPLSVRMKEWVNGLPMPFNILLGIFVLPIALIISIFE